MIEAGVKIVTKAAFYPGSKALISFTIPGYDNMIIAPMTVVWTHVHTSYFEIGVEFTKVERSDKSALRNYLNYRISKTG